MKTRVRKVRLPRGGRLLGPLLGLLFLAYPLGALLASDPAPAQLAFATLGTGLFVGVLLWLLWALEPLGTAAAGAPELRERRAAVALLAAITAALALAFGEEWLALCVHTAVAAGLMLPRREAYRAILGLGILAVALGLASGLGWPEIGRFALPAVLLGLLFVAFAHHVATVAELRAAREEIARLAVVEERLRFARDLHDLLGHSLSLIVLKSELAGRLLEAVPERAASEVREVEGVARRSLREVREAVAGYRRTTLAEELSNARKMLEAAGIGCSVENRAGVLPGGTDAVLAWAVREGVTNVIRHSRAGRCEIRVDRYGGEVRAEVADDGTGPASRRDSASPKGVGLAGMAERAAAGSGAFEAGPRPEGGFRLRVSLPLRDDAASAAELVPQAAGSGKGGAR